MLTIMLPMFNQTDQLNTKQETKTVNIISILPQKCTRNNYLNQKRKPEHRTRPFGAYLSRYGRRRVG